MKDTFLKNNNRRQFLSNKNNKHMSKTKFENIIFDWLLVAEGYGNKIGK